MSFRDQNHINCVRDALWTQSAGGASLMVGAGFSRNAECSRPDIEAMPSWRNIAESMCEKLYPENDAHYKAAIASISEPSGLLRLAQEYKAAFGREKLHSLIRILVRDDYFNPGEHHARLLRLPWRDVFTTNWDTLLERTRSSVIEHVYSVVRNMDEFPQTVRPRIVKLHGSLSAHFPLIITEEDYRTYPMQFAPFVNTVQQAMMESVFCLIGFSGDDPNFLHWSGWVRDNLGQSAPKIYLAGWLNLSSHRRRMLEERNVVPIDLAYHPKSNEWPERQHHRYATEWILHTLENGRPYDVSDWPASSTFHYPEPPPHLQPVQRVISEVPRTEPHISQSLDETKQDKSEEIRNLLDCWTHNRKLYPGWLVLPFQKQSLLTYKTQEWLSLILEALPKFTPMDHLNAIRELVWRKNILMEPLTPELEAAAEGVLNDIDCHNKTIDGIVGTNLDWADIHDACLTIALALVTTARQQIKQDDFDKQIDILSKFQNDNLDVDHQMRYERCLYAINSLDYKALESLLKDWHTDNGDPVWMMRKSALLVEMGRDDEAKQLIVTALATIRENSIDGRSVANASREAWGLWLAISVDKFIADRTDEFRRWEELTVLKCNARMEKHHYAEAIKDKGNKPQALPFDFGIILKPGISFSNVKYHRNLAAHRAIRLTEFAGLPPSQNHFVVASDILGLAAEELSLHDLELAARLVLRITNNDRDKLLSRILSRTRVASMPTDSVEKLAQICLDTVDFALPRTVVPGESSSSQFWFERLRVTIEALSRFVVRLDPEMADSIFGKVLSWYGNSIFAKNFLMNQPLRNILTRSWEALPETCKTNRLLDILVAPIAGMNGFTVHGPLYPDPGDLLFEDYPPPPRTSDNENHWQKVVSILVQGLNEGDEPRKRAAVRMIWVANQSVLEDAEQNELMKALWGENYSNHDELPSGTSLYDWNFLCLPEPEHGLAERRFRRKWLNTSIHANKVSQPVDSILWHVGGTIHKMNAHGKPLEFSDKEKKYLAALVARWADATTRPPIQPPGHREPKFIEDREKIEQAIEGLQFILLIVQTTKATGENVYKKITELNSFGIRTMRLTACLLKVLPHRSQEIIQSMRMAMASDDKSVATDAMQGLWYWLDVTADCVLKLPPPPIDLVREIGVIIATRRKAALAHALQTAKLVFKKCDFEQINAIGELVSQGLHYLAQELRYDGIHDPLKDADVPVLRWGCTQLALTMNECGFGDNPAVAKWVESANKDPLPEVRHTKHPTNTSSS